MNKFLRVLEYVTIVLLICSLICGAWVSTHFVKDMSFHAIFSAISVVMALIMQIINICKCKHCKN